MIIIWAASVLFIWILLLALASKGVKKNAMQKETISLDQEMISRKIYEIDSLLKGSPASVRNALLEMDKLVDYTLKNSGAKGTTFADRLKTVEHKINNKEDLWKAHRLRNRFAHDLGMDLVPSQVQKAVADMKKSIIDLGARI